MSGLGLRLQTEGSVWGPRVHPAWLGKALGGVLALSAQGVEPDPTQGVQAAFWTEGDGPAQGDSPQAPMGSW